MASLGSVTRSSNIQTGGLPFVPTFVLEEDINELQDFLDGSNKYFTRDQRKVADIDQNGYIDGDDLDALFDMLTVTNYMDGNLNLDAEVNSSKLVKLISYILGKHEGEKDSLDYTKLEKDSTVSTNNILEIINQISEDENVQY